MIHLYESYTINDLIQEKGHVFTKDDKYYLYQAGNYDYWKVIKKKSGNIINLGYALGRHSYDYCFRSNVKECLDNLNKLIKEGGKV